MTDVELQAINRLAHSKPSNFKALFKFLMLVGSCVLAWHFWKQTGNPTLDGTVYVITKGQSVIKMPAITVLCLDEIVLREAMQNASASLKKDFPEFLRRYFAADHSGRNKIRDEWKLRQEGLVGVLLALPGSTTKRYGNKKADAFQAVKTDAEGHYSITLPRPGKYVIIGIGERDVIGETEHYVWVSSGNLRKFSNYSCDLNNDALLPYSIDGDLLYTLTLAMEKFGFDSPDLPNPLLDN